MAADQPQTCPLPPGTLELLQLEDVATTVPEELIAHCLRQAGGSTPNPQLIKIIALASQRFVSLVIQDAIAGAKRKGEASINQRRAMGLPPKDKRLVLSTEDVADALAAYGVNVRPAPYFVNR